MKQPPEHIKEKILQFFLKTSVPRLIESRKSLKGGDQDDNGRNAEMDSAV